MSDALARLAEMREFSRTFVVEDEMYVQVLQNDFLDLTEALEEVLAMPILLRGRFDNESNDESQRVGYNRCLAEVKAIIEGKVGVE